jgi:hypothetical protein
MPREWQRGWQVCRSADRELMQLYEKAIEEFRIASTFKRSRNAYRPTIACLKAALKELGVIESDAVAAGTPALTRDERLEFSSRFAKMRELSAETLEHGWVSESNTSCVADRATALRHG